MKLPRDVSGRDLANALVKRSGYIQVHQAGSHMMLDTAIPSHQRIAIPDHKELRVGTLNGILRAVAMHKAVAREDFLASL